jgi:hypothetical protein
MAFTQEELTEIRDWLLIADIRALSDKRLYAITERVEAELTAETATEVIRQANKRAAMPRTGYRRLSQKEHQP